MARKDRVRAYFRRLELIEKLGGKCVECGTKDALEIDHPNGRDYDLRRMDPSWRVSVYWQEHRAGIVLEVRCKRHNANAHKETRNAQA